jgi:Fungal protein kinase
MKTMTKPCSNWQRMSAKSSKRSPESTVEFFLWDRAGVTFSEPFDYHAEASCFCRIIATIVSWKDEELGFDTSAGFAHNTLHIWTPSQSYVVEPTMIPAAQAYSIRNAGTTSWKARASNDKTCNISF